ncbi:MAG: hypothetical protein WC645_06480 [Candidatus Margulisiibacteriota bacterium]
MDWLIRLIIDFSLIIATVWTSNWFQSRNRIEAYRQIIYGKLPDEFDKLNEKLSDITKEYFDLLSDINNTERIKATEKMSASAINQLLNTLTYSNENLAKSLYECNGLMGEISKKARSQTIKEEDVERLVVKRADIIVQMRRQMGIGELLNINDLDKILRRG